MTIMSVVELARLRESSVTSIENLVVGAVFNCEEEPKTVEWAIVVKKLESAHVVGHVSNELACLLFPLLTYC